MAGLTRQCVVVPIDFSDESYKAFDTALTIVDSPTKVHVVHVLTDYVPIAAGEVLGVPDITQRIEAAKTHLKQELARGVAGGMSIDVVVGEPAHAIADFAAEKQADLIVIPSHGRTGLTRLLIGSVAERVVRLAHCPVLVLRS